MKPLTVGMKKITFAESTRRVYRAVAGMMLPKQLAILHRWRQLLYGFPPGRYETVTVTIFPPELATPHRNLGQ